MKRHSLLLIALVLLLLSNKSYCQNSYFPECKGSSLEFDGVDDYVRIENPFYTFSNELSVEWWALYDPALHNGPGSGLGQANPTQDEMNTNVWLMHYWDNVMEFFVNDNGTWTASKAPLKPGWHHWVGVANRNSVQLYMDGEKVGSTGKGLTKIKNVPSSVIDFGKDTRYSEGRWMSGKIDEVRVWNSALSQATIQSWMDIPLTSSHPNYENLKGYWKLDEGGGDLVKDASPLKRNGKLFNGTYWLTETMTCKKLPATATFTLIDAEADKDLVKIKDGDTLNLAVFPTTQLNIRANTDPNTYSIGSVIFNLNGPLNYKQVENIAPYALLGNNNNDYLSPFVLKPGNYTLTATPYLGANGSGEQGTPLTIMFHVIYQVVNKLVLVNAETDEDIKVLKNGDKIDLSILPTNKLNIRAVVHPSKVGSVLFNLNNKLTVRESYGPYAIGGDINGNYRSWALPVGRHTLTATPYELMNGAGLKGQAYTINFTVLDPLATSRLSAINQLQNSAVINSETGKANLSAQPNPFTSSTTISFSVPQTGFTTLQLCNSTGAILENLYGAVAEFGMVNSLQVQSKGLPNGMYMLRLTSGSQVQSFKLLLVR